MSDNFLRFIPEDVNSCRKLSLQETTQIKALLEPYKSWDLSWNDISVCESEKIFFADAGENFESVSCPFCDQSLERWWGDAMSAACNEDQNNFECLDVTTPCCNKTTSLHDLNYYFNQGFYKTIVEIANPSFSEGLTAQEHAEIIEKELFRITECRWRIIFARL